MNISEYIKQSTGLNPEEMEKISLCDWIKKNPDEGLNFYKVKSPRLIKPRGSLYAYYERYIQKDKVNDYINKI